MGTPQTRLNKISWMRGKINWFFDIHPNGSIEKSKLLAEFAIANSSTERTGEEILRLLEKSGEITLKGEEICK